MQLLDVFQMYGSLLQYMKATDMIDVLDDRAHRTDLTCVHINLLVNLPVAYDKFIQGFHHQESVKHVIFEFKVIGLD